MNCIAKCAEEVIVAIINLEPIPGLEIGLYTNPMAKWFWLVPVEVEDWEAKWEGYQRQPLLPGKWVRDTYKIRYSESLQFDCKGEVAGWFLAREGRIFMTHELEEMISEEGGPLTISVVLSL